MRQTFLFKRLAPRLTQIILTYKNTHSKAHLSVFPVLHFMWRCKDCGRAFTRRPELIKHYKLNHRHYGRGHSYPCTYLNCACRFKTWNALLSHLSRNHSAQRTVTKVESTFTCHICGHNHLSMEREYFQHIFQHLKNKEVTCLSMRTSIVINTGTELQLEKGNPEYHVRHKMLTVTSRIKSDILNRLVEEIYQYKQGLPTGCTFLHSCRSLNQKASFFERTLLEIGLQQFFFIHH